MSPDKLEKAIKAVADSYKNGTSGFDKFSEQIEKLQKHADLNPNAFRTFGFKSKKQ